MLEHRRELGPEEGWIVEAQKRPDGGSSDGQEVDGVEAYRMASESNISLAESNIRKQGYVQ